MKSFYIIHQGDKSGVDFNMSGMSRFIGEMKCDYLGNIKPLIDITQFDQFIYKIIITFEVPDSIRQNDWKTEIIPAFNPDFHWAPHLTPEDGYVIDQHSFRSPCMIASSKNRQLIVIPDMDLMKQDMPSRWYMDLNAQNNVLTLGMSLNEVEGHVLYKKKAGAVYLAGKLQFGFYMILSHDPEALKNPWRKVLQFLWDKWGKSEYKKRSALKRDYEIYIEHTYNWAFKSWKNNVWQEFELDGKKVGAPVFIVNVTQSPNYKGPVNEREVCSIWNQAWFSSLRSAQGLYRYGRRNKSPEYIEKANMVKELALSAPQTHGFFPSVIGTNMETVVIDGIKVNRSLGWNIKTWGNSDRNPFTTDFKNSPYHILDMSWTALLMLRWYEELEKDNRLLTYSRSYGDALIRIQDESGFFPAWLDKELLKPMGVLDRSPETSLSVTFLLKLSEITGETKYECSALRAIAAVIKEIIPEGRWEDFETYWSCSPYGKDEIVGQKVKRNNMYKQCNFSMFWTAEALFYCYKRTGKVSYLTDGRRCMDEMLMTQTAWQPPFMEVSVFGGFGVMNCDAEWNDARQSLFAELILLYSDELECEEYRQRGLAALGASFVMMYCPENPDLRSLWEKRWPFFDNKDYGFMMENYGHNGIMNNGVNGIGEFTIFDWGNGSACEAYLRILDHFGRDFIQLNSSPPIILEDYT